jgi:bifunctional non-homologous end joining protein LigD
MKINRKGNHTAVRKQHGRSASARTDTVEIPSVHPEKTDSEHSSPVTKISSAASKQTVKVNGKQLTLTNQNKLYWPTEKITKGDVLNYYNDVHKFILPHIKNRPQSLRRNPNGILDEGFFQKNADERTPAWVKTIKLRAESANRSINYIICNDLATMMYMNNLGCIEINPWNSRIGKLDYPDYIVIDLDPSEKNTFEQVIDAALLIKEILDQAGAPSYCKTSGASGLHIFIPTHAQYTYEEARAFTEKVMLLAQMQLRDIATTERAIDKRNGKLYLDYLQNTKGQTVASVYSLRPKPGATISTPLQWNELKPGLHPSQFNIHNFSKRLKKMGNLFEGVLTGKTNLKKCIKQLDKIYGS